MVEIAIICATVGLICPMMSCIATFLYCWGEITSLWSFISLWLHTIMHNFPLAFFSQLFFIQPFVRIIFGLLFKSQLKQVEAGFLPRLNKHIHSNGQGMLRQRIP
jgi:hypothetical protein